MNISFFYIDMKIRVAISCLLFFFAFSFSMMSQVTFSKLPKDLQLYPRDVNNKGTVEINGENDRSVGPNYDQIRVTVKRNGIIYGTPHLFNLVYTNDIALFNFSIDIDAELANYSFEIQGRFSGSYFFVTTIVEDVVAGDVYIIQGQSNAEARLRSGGQSANGFMDNFIRVYASGTDSNTNLLTNDTWYVGDGNVTRDGNGNTGQWGLKLAWLLVQSQNVPIAIFNGARGGRPISYFLENAGSGSSLNNYQRLLYRLDTTGLKNSVKGIFWSQGETVTNINSVNDYKNAFTDLQNSWKIDYPNVEKFYIFQVRTGCSATTNFTRLMYTKEAQRQLAEDNLDTFILPTDGVIQNSNDTCHFEFVGGYEEFANRLNNLVLRDFYGGISGEFEPPNIIDAYLTDETTLVVETDALGLSAVSIIDNFELNNANSANIIDIALQDNKIIFTLSNNPGSSATISNLGSDPNVNTGLITNVNGIELVAFYQFNIDASRFTIWESNLWSNNIPNLTRYAIINDDYNALDGSIFAKNLTINSGSNLDFNSGTINSIVLDGDLTVDGTFTIGDQESLVMTDDNASITGNISKIENSTVRNNTYDFTYWSSPVINENIENVFTGVTSSRIFQFNANLQVSNPSDPDYYAPWVVASGNMIPGKGYITEGLTGTTGIHNISFSGTPNNGLVEIAVIENNDADIENDYNLIGNPYPSAIDIELFFTHNNTLIEPVVYLWTHNTPISNGSSGDYINSDYATYNFTGGVGSGTNPNGTIIPTKNIGSGQGFFIIANSSGLVAFNNAMRMVSANNQFFKAEQKKEKTERMEKDRIWLNLTSNEGGFKQLLIGFLDGATDEIDKRYDAKGLYAGNVLSFYSKINEDKFIIQGKPAFNKEQIIYLGYRTEVAPRTLTISIDKTEGVLKDAKVYLIDNFLNITHNLKMSDYQFEQVEIGDFPNRFKLQFVNQILDVDNHESKGQFIVSNEFERLKIYSNKLAIKSIKVYDLLGRVIIQKNPNKKSFYLNTSHIKKGTILLIEAVLENGLRVNKKTIKF